MFSKPIWFNLDNKIFTEVKDGGANFSSGQIQRLAIARHLYLSPELIILDEATNAMDKKLQNKIIENILKLKDITLISISHDQEVVKNFEKI